MTTPRTTHSAPRARSTPARSPTRDPNDLTPKVGAAARGGFEVPPSATAADPPTQAQGATAASTVMSLVPHSAASTQPAFASRKAASADGAGEEAGVTGAAREAAAAAIAAKAADAMAPPPTPDVGESASAAMAVDVSGSVPPFTPTHYPAPSPPHVTELLPPEPEEACDAKLQTKIRQYLLLMHARGYDFTRNLMSKQARPRWHTRAP